MAKHRPRKIPDLTVDQRVAITPAVKEWANATAYLLKAIHAGSYGVRFRRRLSAAYREKLSEKLRKARAAGARCQVAKLFPELPPYSQRKALNVKLVLDCYYAAVGEGLTASYAEYVARALWLIIFGKATASRNLRRIIARVNRCGGPARAPIEAYSDQKSVPHPKSTEKKSRNV